MFRWVKCISPVPKIVHNRSFKNISSENSKVMKIAVLGAAGRTGRCLSLLLKRSSIVEELALYDELPTEGLALELNHVNTPCKVNGYSGISRIEDALRMAKVVVITAGTPAMYKRSGGEMLKTNANILADLIPHVIQFSPRAMVAVVTSPVNILIPLIAEMYKKSGLYELNNIFGVTTLDCVRSNTFAAEVLGLAPESVVVPVIGGNCAKTCIPLFSYTKPCCDLTNEEISRLTSSVRLANEDLLKSYNGNGSPSLGMAFASARFCISLCKGLRGLSGVVECAYVRSCVVPDVTYFSSQLELGPNGIQKNLGVPPLTNYECKMLDSAIPVIQAGIKIGEAFLCLNTFPGKVTELNSLIDDYKPGAINKSRGNVTQVTSPGCLSIDSTTPDCYYFLDGNNVERDCNSSVGSCYSTTTHRDRCKSRNGICKRRYRPYLRRRSRPLAHILAALVNKVAICTQAMFIKPSKYIIETVTAMFLQRERLEHVKRGTSTVWNPLRGKDCNCSVVNSLISTTRPAAIRLIADTTILKRWLQALALSSVPTNQSLSQAIKTTETIDGWAYELFFHLKYLQVMNFPCDAGQKNRRKSVNEKDESPARNKATFPESDAKLTDEVMQTNIWHRIVQLRDHYAILYETLLSNSQFLKPHGISEKVNSS